jgi:hypothetical protein
MNWSMVGIFNFDPKRYMPEWKVETQKTYYGPILAKIVRISWSTCVDLSIP